MKKADPRAPMGKTTNWFSNWKRDGFKGFEPKKDATINIEDD